MAHEFGNLTTLDGMIIGKQEHNMTYYANNPCIVIDKGSGTLLKMGDQTTNPLDAYYQTTVDRYNKAGFTYIANDLILINFDRYQTLNIEEICTLMNFMMNSIGPEKMNALLNMAEPELKSEIKRLTDMGW